MKRILQILICLIISILVLTNIDKISNKIVDYFEQDKTTHYYKKHNEYYKDYDFKFISRTKSYVPYGYQDLLNIIYSILNNGWDTFTFNCPNEYENCIKDFESITKDEILLSNINNYVSPFNSYSNFNTSYSSTGEITIDITHLYNNDDVKRINESIDSIIEELITEDLSEDDKILKIHDYIINNTKYDVNHENTESYTALGPLFKGTAVCSGYADIMAIFLDRLNIKNFKVTSETYVWNAVYVNNEWLNLDLTWDNPITKNSNVDTLQHEFFLIKTDKLLDFDIDDHKFDTTVYQELK